MTSYAGRTTNWSRWPRRSAASIATPSRLCLEAWRRRTTTRGDIPSAAIAVALATRLGYRGDELEAIEIGALLHDVGKIGIPERVLNKPAPLDAEEWAVMKRHPLISDQILAEVELHPIVRQIARSSHERIDGGGYPDGLAGEEIPMPARITLVADAFDALTSDRPYRSACSIDAAFQELSANSGTQFCADVLAALEQIRSAEPELLAAVPRARLMAVAGAA